MVTVNRSSGNVFADLGFGVEESVHLRVRSDLMLDLRQFVENSGVSQSAIARIFGVSQPRVSDLVRGRIDLFSTDSLIDMAARAGLSVQISVEGQAGLTAGAPDFFMQWEDQHVPATPHMSVQTENHATPAAEEFMKVAA